MSSLNSYFNARELTNQLEKIAVAAHVHRSMLKKLDSVFLDGGSACCAISQEMTNGGEGHFTVVTNNMRALDNFRRNRTIRVIVTGGFYVVEDEALVGKEAMLDFQQYCFRYAIIGASAVNSHFVYNHGVIGEDEIKKHYWKIPAQELIVPANLAKFARKDLLCFGALTKEAEDDHVGTQVGEIAASEVARTRAEEQRRQFKGEMHRGITGFSADKCTIVIEPEWMIKDNPLFQKDPDLRDQCIATVEDINRRRGLTHVEVIHAEVTRKQFKAKIAKIRG